MSKWMLWMMLSMLTGSPLLSLGLMVVIVFAADHFTWQLLPSPVRLLKRFQRADVGAGAMTDHNVEVVLHGVAPCVAAKRSIGLKRWRRKWCETKTVIARRPQADEAISK